MVEDAGSSPLRKSQFPGESRAFGLDGACARLESPAVRREVHCVRRVVCQSRARAPAGGGEDWLTHVGLAATEGRGGRRFVRSKQGRC